MAPEEIPSQKRIRKDVKKFTKEFRDNSVVSELIKRKVTLVWVTIFVVVGSFFIFSEIFFEEFNISKPNIQGNFIIDSCTIEGFSCDMQVYGKDAILSLDLGDYKLVGADIKECGSVEIKENNIIGLYNCTFSSVTNNVEIRIDYENPVSGLTHHTKANVVKFFESTRLGHIISSGYNSVKNGIKSIIGNNSKAEKQ